MTVSNLKQFGYPAGPTLALQIRGGSAELFVMDVGSDLERLRVVVNNMVDVVITTDETFAIQFISPSVEPVLGYTPEQAQGGGLLTAVHPEDLPRLQALFAEIVAGRATGRIEVRMRHARSGDYLWFDAVGKTLMDANGRFVGNVVVLRDIGTRKRAEAALIDAEERYRTVIDAASEVIFQTDSAGRWRLLSRSWTTLTGYGVDESLGRLVLDFAPLEDQADLRDVAREVFRSGEVVSRRCTRLVTKSGQTRWIEFSASLSRDRAQQVTGAAGTIRDVTSTHLRGVLNEIARSLDHQILEGGQRDVILQGVCDGVAGAMTSPAVWIGLRRGDGGLHFVASAPSVAQTAQALPLRRDEPPSEEGPDMVAVSTRRTQTLKRASCLGQGWVRNAMDAGIAQVTIIPLVTTDSVLGVLGVAASDDNSFDVEQASALESFAERLSLSLQLAEHHELLALQGAAMASSSNALFLTDSEGRIEWVNAAFERMSGYSQKEAVGQTPKILRCELQPTDVFQSMWAEVRAGATWRGEIVNRRKSGETYVVLQTVTPLVNKNGSVTHLAASQEDVTARRKAETLLEHMAHHDMLTDLPNRALFTERLQVAMARADHAAEPVGVLFLDLDQFKLVNDTLGHKIGDGILCEVAQRLRGCVRDHDLLARFGGDEFTVVLPSCDADIAARIAERIREALSQPVRVTNHDVSISASIGIAFMSRETPDAVSLLKRADAAMYQAKEMGRNGHAFYSADLDRKPVSGLTIQSGLRRALTQGELKLNYQPQMSASKREFVGVEALLRWTSPVLGVVSPADFIPIAEQTGLIVDIDRWVLRAACVQAKAWQDSGVNVPRVAVNLSGVTFRRGQLFTWIEEALAAARLAPEFLEIELTEGMVMNNGPKVTEMLAGLRGLGVRVALDDFGTGYSSLSYLKRFKLDTLKIDRSFVTGLPDDQESVAIARLIVAMAKALHMDSVAEGVETAEQATFLESIGCNTFQGYLFSPGLTPDKLAEFARRARPEGGDNVPAPAGSRPHAFL